MKLYLFNFVAASLTLLIFPASATTFYINVSNTVSASPFTNWVTAATNIQDAIDVSSDGDLILVTNGVYTTGGRVVYGALTNRVVIDKAVTLQSVNGPTKTFIQGNPSTGDSAVRCAYLTNNAVLAGFTLTNGATRASGDAYEEQSGGGIWCESASATVSNCVVAKNKAWLWGGGTVSGTLISCTLTNNTASLPTSSQGGGAFAGMLTNCIIVHNSAAFGGGAASNTLFNCTLNGNWATKSGGGSCSNILNNCTLNGNWATISGGGTFSSTLMNCFLSGNWSTNGGGAAFGALVGCTLTNNSASNGGGACSNTLNNCLLINNRAGTNGGGAFSCTLSNCTLSGNSAGPIAFSTGGGACLGTLDNCCLSNNFAVHGGGTSSNTLNNCILFSNTATDGGGAFVALLNSCVLKNNTASLSGGGSYGGTLNGCILDGNQAGYGGGANQGNLNNCLVINNSATTPGFQAGGAYYCNLTNCTVTGNLTPLGLTAAVAGNSTVTSVNCIVYYNQFGNFYGGNYFNCCTTPLPIGGSGNFTNAPLFVDSVGHPQTNSLCIDAGNNAYTNSITDLDGRPRVVNGTVDVGAYEFQGANLEPFIVWLYQCGLPDDGSADYADSDGTGMNNWQKWIAGLNPTNAASVLALKSPSVTVSNATITWSSVTSRTYYVQRSSNLSQPLFSSIQSNIIGQVGTTSFKDTTATNGNSFFYRVGVQ
jgi:hypothetical protein